MNIGKTVFAQLMDFLPSHEFHKCVERYKGNYKVKSFSCLDQFQAMAFAQLTYRESLRDIEASLGAAHSKLYHMGFRSKVSRNTLANANSVRDYRIYEDFAQFLIAEARELYAGEDFGLELSHTTYALDSSTIDLCLSLFPWAKFRKRKAAVKMHTLLDLRGNIPTLIWITSGKVHDVKVMDHLLYEPGAIYLMDRAYVDYARLYRIHLVPATFITRTKKNSNFRRLYSAQVDKESGLLFDQTIALAGHYTSKKYPGHLRRIGFLDAEREKRLEFLTNNFVLAGLMIARLYKCRWQVELFFKWIKQHLRIKSFYGTSENAVKTQIWVAISVYVLVSIVKKRLRLDLSLYTILQILSVTLFEREPLIQLLTKADYTSEAPVSCKQLNLFD